MATCSATEAPPLLTTAQAAAKLQVSEATLRIWAKTGRVAAIRHGREYRFEAGALTQEKGSWRSTNVPGRRSGGLPSAYLVNLDFESQLSRLIETKRSAPTTASRRNFGQRLVKLTVDRD